MKKSRVGKSVQYKDAAMGVVAAIVTRDNEDGSVCLVCFPASWQGSNARPFHAMARRATKEEAGAGVCDRWSEPGR